jgi:hypothetical protein
MRRPLAALITLSQLHPLVAVALCLTQAVGPSGLGRDCQDEPGHAAGVHAAVAIDHSAQLTIGVQPETSGPEGCPVAASCAPAPLAPYLTVVHPAGITPEGATIGLPVDLAVSLSQFPPPTPPPNS